MKGKRPQDVPGTLSTAARTSGERGARVPGGAGSLLGMGIGSDRDGFYLTCDVCGDGWYTFDGDVRFTDLAALELMARACGWELARTAVCGTCRLVEVCRGAGHRWGAWTVLELPGVQDRGQLSVRFCDLCGEGEYRCD